MKSKRMSRRNFWHTLLIIIGIWILTILVAVQAGLDRWLFGQFTGGDRMKMSVWLSGLVGWPIILILVSSLALTVITTICLVRRYHDTGRSGWYVLWGLVPVIGPLVLLVEAGVPGHPNENAWGEPQEDKPSRTLCQKIVITVAYLAAGVLWLGGIRDNAYIAFNKDTMDWGRIQQMADRGNKYACCLAADYYFAGQSDPYRMIQIKAGKELQPISKQDIATAVKYLRKAAKAGVPLAQSRLGDLYMRGYGVKKNEKAAISWYKKAAKQGDGFAKDALKKL